LSIGAAGIPFCGADVGGFFGNPSAELLTRWYQLGAYQPFFRAHAHIDAKRREPWLFGEPWTDIIRDAIRSRYRLLPYLYSLNLEAHVHGWPIMRAMIYVFPGDGKLLDLDDQYMLGDGLLIKPVGGEGLSSVDVLLPEGKVYHLCLIAVV
jgi:alpha 1,3-glucosidase